MRVFPYSPRRETCQPLARRRSTEAERAKLKPGW